LNSGLMSARRFACDISAKEVSSAATVRESPAESLPRAGTRDRLLAVPPMATGIRFILVKSRTEANSSRVVDRCRGLHHCLAIVSSGNLFLSISQVPLPVATFMLHARRTVRRGSTSCILWSCESVLKHCPSIPCRAQKRVRTFNGSRVIRLPQSKIPTHWFVEVDNAAKSVSSAIILLQALTTRDTSIHEKQKSCRINSSVRTSVICQLPSGLPS